MNIQSVYANSSFLRILIHSQRLKWPSSSKKNFLCSNKILQNFYEPISRVICTDSNLQTCNYEIQEHDKEQQSFYLQENFLKENFNIVDSRYFKLVTLPNECNNFEELLFTNEFKNILSRSSFSYDVYVLGGSGNFLSQTESLNPHVSHNILYFNKNSTLDKQTENTLDTVFTSNSRENVEGKATEEQLLHIINRLTYSLINFFEKPHDYSIYHKNIIFLNNIKGVTVKGLSAYAQAMYLMKLYGFLHFAKVKVEILKVTHHIEDGTVRVRWRVNGLPRHKFVLMLWKHKVMNVENLPQEETEWLDGFSVFSVGSDGLINKHICDKMIPDNEKSVSKNVDLKSKVLGLLGLTPRTPAGTINTLIPCCRSSDLFSGKKLT